MATSPNPLQNTVRRALLSALALFLILVTSACAKSDIADDTSTVDPDIPDAIALGEGDPEPNTTIPPEPTSTTLATLPTAPALNVVEPSGSSLPATATTSDTARFASASQPFSTEVVAVVNDGLELVDTATGEVVASDPRKPAYSGMSNSGAVYLVDDRHVEKVLRLWRFDANGLEWVDIESQGATFSYPDAATPTLVTYSVVGPVFTWVESDGQVRRQLLEAGDTKLRVYAFGETILVADEFQPNAFWLLNKDLSVAGSFSVGQLDTRPVLIDESTLRVRKNQVFYDVNLDTFDAVVVPTRQHSAGQIIEPIGDGVVAVLADDVLEVRDQNGDVLVEQTVSTATGVAAFAHPTQDAALISIQTCFNADGNLCEAPPLESDEEKPYIAPAFVELFHLDLTTNVLTRIDFGGVHHTTVVALTTDSGWLAAAAIDSTATIMTIDADGAVQVVGESEKGYADSVVNATVPIGDHGLALSGTSLFLLTNDGLREVPGDIISRSSAPVSQQFVVMR